MGHISMRLAIVRVLMILLLGGGCFVTGIAGATRSRTNAPEDRIGSSSGNRYRLWEYRVGSGGHSNSTDSTLRSKAVHRQCGDPKFRVYSDLLKYSAFVLGSPWYILNEGF